jgi:hypothetical protein
MSTQTITPQVRWQDFNVRTETDTVLEMARRKGWQDCEIFGSGAMITQPREEQGWTLIPADGYEYSIPPEAADRLLQVINAGVRVQGVIIADDQRREAPAPPPEPVSPAKPLEWFKPLAAGAGKALLWLAGAAAILALFVGMASIMILAAPVLIGMMMLGGSTGMAYDPKLVILVDDGSGGSTWISLFTWYE